MRLIARFPNQDQVNSLVDSLRNIGFSRDNMIISDLADEQPWNSIADAAQHVIFIKTERDGLGEIGDFKDGVKGLKGSEGIIVAVEAPKHAITEVSSLMEQSGAVEIIRD